MKQVTKTAFDGLVTHYYKYQSRVLTVIFEKMLINAVDTYFAPVIVVNGFYFHFIQLLCFSLELPTEFWAMEDDKETNHNTRFFATSTG